MKVDITLLYILDFEILGFLNKNKKGMAGSSTNQCFLSLI